MVENAPETTQMQSQHLLAVLLRVRASVMLDVTLGDGKLDPVSITCTSNAEIPAQELMSKMHPCYCMPMIASCYVS